MTPTPHPAKFNPAILNVIREHVDWEVGKLGRPIMVLDPFAGVGGIHELQTPAVRTFGIEIEREWASQSGNRGLTLYGDFFDLARDSLRPGFFDVVATSPVYGNRMSDHHEAKDGSKRITYRHKLGRPLTPNNSGMLQWGDEYRHFHRRAWIYVHRLLTPGGLFILNIKDHIRKGVAQDVPEWHKNTITTMLPFELVGQHMVNVPGMGFGQHQQTQKIAHEHVYLFRKVEP